MPDVPPPTLRLRIDSEALAANWHALDRMSAGASAGAAVKADCYGLGVTRCVPTLRDAGARHFFVAHWSEVAEVAAHVAPGSISVLHGPLTAEDAAYARATGVRPVLNSLHQVRLWLESGGGPCDVMLDSGMNRLGLSPQDMGHESVGKLSIDTFMSHLASADEDSPLNARQLQVFAELAAQIPAHRRSLANSAGIALGPDYHFDLTRPGLALYGGVPRRELGGIIGQVAFPQAAVIQLRDLRPGDSVGYNALFTAEREMRAAVVSLGYADGFLLCRGRGAELAFEGASLPLIGKVSMDMVVVDCSAAPQLREGDWLDIPQYLPVIATNSGLSQYEILTVTGRRFR